MVFCLQVDEFYLLTRYSYILRLLPLGWRLRAFLKILRDIFHIIFHLFDWYYSALERVCLFRAASISQIIIIFSMINHLKSEKVKSDYPTLKGNKWIVLAVQQSFRQYEQGLIQNTNHTNIANLPNGDDSKQGIPPNSKL